MIVVAVITLVIIVLTSFNFNHKQQRKFQENVAEADFLFYLPLHIIETGDSTSVESQSGKNIVLVFWASWSEKSQLMLNEIQALQSETQELSVIAGLVKDAEESLPSEKTYPAFTYVDGTKIFNDLKVPGFPSYILFNSAGEVLYAHVGYQKGAGYDTLKTYLE